MKLMKMTKQFITAAMLAGLAAGALRAHADDDHKNHDEKAQQKEAEAKPFPATTCLISGDALDSMGKPYVMVYEGQELKFCCSNCVKDFQKDKAGYMKKLADAEAKAKPYPLQKCVVSGEAYDHDKPYVFAYEGQQVKLCCKDCLKDFKKDPAKFMKKIDEAAKTTN